MNNILALQNDEGNLRYRRAIRATYDTAQDIVLLQVICAVAIPVVAALVTFVLPDAKPYTAALSMLLVLADIYYLDRRQKALLKLGAKFGEEFDTRVLNLPWDNFTVGDKTTPEELHAAEIKFKARTTKAEFTDWYPVAVGAAPLHLARLLCQRANLSYDEALRRDYSRFVVRLALGITAALFVVALAQNLPLKEFILVVSPAMPALAWAGREFLRQRDAADAQDSLRKQARKVWDDALAGHCSEDSCLLKAREFQSAVYLRRSSAPMILPGMYKSKRAVLEDQMNSTAADFLAEYQRSIE
ncbi:hypothetical protein ABAC460_13090 [Asticcacaulis sp. AC460]|uniref:S-4TM family putative pore-forming effector n=1 Tax=Asticcacaulis sp. AC460 TaxID=1282360 RepID=UPI0003C3CC3E|nr:S-4TM family putative pore-forming effector [Asticcacaulis sp. AC460]ESQ89226.1 hypothetical protein ABAC460_13090 [Asticcacaulis sp. AC460]